MGRNGSGKSTLLKTLAGLLPVSEGQITYPERDLRSFIGMSSLDGSTYPDLTMQEHLELTSELRNCPSRCAELMNLTDCGYAANYFAKDLSTGMRSRLRLMMAIQPNPKILMLDEPGAGLDESGLQTLRRIIQDQSQAGSVLLATNDPAERSLANDVIELD